MKLGVTSQIISIHHQLDKLRGSEDRIMNRLITGEKNFGMDGDVVAMQRVRHNNSRINDIDNFMERIQRARLMVDTGFNAAQRITELLTSAKNLAVNAGNDNINDADRIAINEELQGIFKQIDHIAASASVDSSKRSLVDGSFGGDVYVEFEYVSSANAGHNNLGDGVYLIIPGRDDNNLKLESTGTAIALVAGGASLELETKQIISSKVVNIAGGINDNQFSDIKDDITKHLQRSGISNFKITKAQNNKSVTLQVNGIELTTDTNVGAPNTPYEFKTSNIFNTPGQLATSNKSLVGAQAIHDHVGARLKFLSRQAQFKVEGIDGENDMSFNVGNCYCASLFRGSQMTNTFNDANAANNAPDLTMYHDTENIPVISSRETARNAVGKITHAISKMERNLGGLKANANQVNDSRNTQESVKSIYKKSNIDLRRVDYSEEMPNYSQVRTSSEVSSSMMSICIQQQLKGIMKLLRVLE